MLTSKVKGRKRRRTIRSQRRERLEIIKINRFSHLLRPPSLPPQMLLPSLQMKSEKSLRMKQSFAPL